MDMIIAICPICGANCHGWDDESAKESLKKHNCMGTLTDRQIAEILDDVRGVLDDSETTG
jgi:hypothetical protein